MAKTDEERKMANREKAKRYRANHPDRVKALCQKSKDKRRANTKRHYHKHADQFKAKRIENRTRDSAYHKSLGQSYKLEAITHYGGKCKECGECRLEFLTLDHINNDGADHRRTGVKSGVFTYRWAKKNGWPKIFQVLCHNHNTKKEMANRSAASVRVSNWHMANKKLCFEHYGSLCSCCGEKDEQMLQIDHINGGGTQHRKTEKTTSIHMWAKKNGFPPIFRTLCANCNFSSHIGGGVCLHQRLSSE